MPLFEMIAYVEYSSSDLFYDTVYLFNYANTVLPHCKSKTKPQRDQQLES